MNIKLHPDDQAKAEAMVASGRFESMADVFHAGLEALDVEEKTIPWTAELQQAVDAGVVAMARGDFANEADVDSLFEQYPVASA